MKKLLIFLAALMAVCTSCADIDKAESEKSQDSSSFITEVITEVPELISQHDEKGYNEVIETYRQCMAENKLGNMMQLAFPDRYFDVFDFLAESSGMTVGEVMGTMQSYNENTITINEILSDDIMTDTAPLVAMLDDVYGDYQLMSDYIISKGGRENVVSEEFQEFCESDSYNVDDVTLYFEPEDVHILNCSMQSTVETDDGEPVIDTYEQEFVVYFIDGEGWKMDIYSAS